MPLSNCLKTPFTFMCVTLYITQSGAPSEFIVGYQFKSVDLILVLSQMIIIHAERYGVLQHKSINSDLSDTFQDKTIEFLLF